MPPRRRPARATAEPASPPSRSGATPGRSTRRSAPRGTPSRARAARRRSSSCAPTTAPRATRAATTCPTPRCSSGCWSASTRAAPRSCASCARRSTSTAGARGSSRSPSGTSSAGALGKPLWRLLGGRSERLLAYASSGELGRAGGARGARRRAARRGVRAVKMRFHHADWRARRGGRRGRARRRRRLDVELMVDANQGWRMAGDRDAALGRRRPRRSARGRSSRSACTGSRSRCRPPTSRATRGCAAGTTLRIAAGEMVRGLHEARDLVLRGGVDVIQPDVVLAGGIGGCRRIAALADLCGRAFSPHTWSNGFGLRGEPAPRAGRLDVPVRRGAARPARRGRPRGATGCSAGPRSRSRPTARSRRRRARASGVTPDLDALEAHRVADGGSAPPSCTSTARRWRWRRSSSTRRGPARCSCASPPPASATRTCTWPTATWATAAGRSCSATRARAWSRRWARGSTHVAPGDAVAFCFVPPCGACAAVPRPGGCNALRDGLAPAAWAGTLLDGTSRLHVTDGGAVQHFNFVSCFAERCVVPAGAAVPLPRGLPLWQASLLGCGVVTAVGAVRNAARVAPGDSVCVIGLRRRRAAGRRRGAAGGRRAHRRRRARRGEARPRPRARGDAHRRRRRRRRSRRRGARRSCPAASTTPSRPSARPRRSGSPGTCCARARPPIVVGIAPPGAEVALPGARTAVGEGPARQLLRLRQRARAARDAWRAWCSTGASRSPTSSPT